MCETQRQVIKSFTQESLDQCTEIMKENFEKIKNDMLDKLVSGVRLDIFDKINGTIVENNTEVKIYTFEDVEKKCLNINCDGRNNDIKERMKTLLSNGMKHLREISTLKNGEHIVHYINYNRIVYNNQGGYSQSGEWCVVIILGIVTNHSNLTWLEIKTRHNRYNNYIDDINTVHKKYDMNTPLHNIFINVMMAIKSLSPQLLNSCMFTSGQKGGSWSQNSYNERDSAEVYITNTHRGNALYCPDTGCANNDRCIILYREMYDIIVKILDMNKKYSMNMLVELDLQKKYEKLLKDKDAIEVTNKLLEDKIKKLENQLKDSIPVEHQCCICFGYTDKKTICVPCGHAQYCCQCIKKLSKCAICRESVTSVVKTYS